MSASPTSEPASDFVCARDERLIALKSQGLLGAWVSFCGEPFYREHEGKMYCVLHFPGKEKSADFVKILQQKLDNNDPDFSDIWFPDPVSFSGFEFGEAMDFSGATFNAKADFTYATFKAQADFKQATFNAEADFYGATFMAEADFNFASFMRVANFNGINFNGYADFNGSPFVADANFNGSTFRAKVVFLGTNFGATAGFGFSTFTGTVDFSGAAFRAEADFLGTTFSGDANFSDATFNSRTNFRNATFRSYFKFAGREGNSVFSDAAALNLEFARVEAPERFSFHTLRLRPQWFVNIDPRRFEFTNVEWTFTTSQEIRDLSIPMDKTVWYSGEQGLGASTHQLLAIAFRKLAVNAEENHRYEEASKFRYLAMNVHRREHIRGFAFWRLSWWYWLANGYGERMLRAFLVLLTVWFVAGLLYTRVGFARWEPRLASESDVAAAKRDETGAPLKFSRALSYSAGVMTLQKPEPKPATTTAQTIVLAETILGPVQAALLALAIRRKFMR